jgi:hypothetical protein
LNEGVMQGAFAIQDELPKNFQMHPRKAERRRAGVSDTLPCRSVPAHLVA